MDKKLKQWPVAFGLVSTILIWIVIFAYMIVPQEIRFVSDHYPRVILATEPIDPFDVMRGDYVTLSYPGLQPEDAFLEERKMGDVVYVVLEISADQRATASEFTRNRPQSGLFLKGKVGKVGWQKQLVFGLEHYFVPQGQGRVLEQLRNEQRLEIEAAIDPKSGRATITGKLIDGEQVETLPATDEGGAAITTPLQ